MKGLVKMSVRAYKITKLEYEPEESFSISYNTLLMDLLDDVISPQLNNCGSGIVCLSNKDIKEVLQRLEKLKDHEEYEDTKKILEQLLEDTKDEDTYYMYF